jgi:opacity protein-like surface antigen
MKKTLLFAICILFISSAFAQKLHFGLGVTPSLSWVHPGTDNLEGDGSKFGFNYGLITEFAITENYSFATGITIENKGGKVKINVADTIIHQDLTLRYVDIPLTLKMKTNQVGSIRYYGQFGLAPGFLIGARENTSDIDIKDGTNDFNVSLVIGLGLEYNLTGTTNLLIGLIYKNGFSDIVNGSESKANINTLGLNIGVLF